jgi:chitinase
MALYGRKALYARKALYSRKAPARALSLVATTGFAAASVLMVPAVSEAKAAATSPAFPAHYAAPYLQIASSDAGDMAADMKATGLKYYTLAFLTPKSGCTPEWEDNGDSVSAFTSKVKALQAAGGNVIPSFGGESGGELAEKCTSVSSLEAAYANVVNTYGVTRLDFDIEGSVLDNTSANTRRDQALAELQKADPSVQIDWTIPVDPTGLESDALTLLKGAKSAGVKTNLVNIMTMDFGDGQNALKDAESAATATEKQLAGIYTTLSSSQVWGTLGLTPIAGKNDDNENFTQANATTLETFAAGKGVQELAFWEVDQYDKPLGYAYSKIFSKITS